MKKLLVLLSASLIVIAGCGTFQSAVKSSFPYTAQLTVSASAKPGDEVTAINHAKSFDQNFTRDGNNAYKIEKVTVSSARLRSYSPTNFNIGNLEWVKIYISRDNGNDEIMIASRNDISENVGNSLVLDLKSDQYIDKLVREPNIKVRMVYKVRKGFDTDAGLQLILGLSAHPAG